MGILDNMQPEHKNKGCKIWRIRQDLELSDQKILDDLVGNELEWSAEVLARQLVARGVSIGAQSIRVHRTGNCACRNLK